MSKKFITPISILLLFCIFSAPVQALTFNPEHIISDEEMKDADSMSLADIDLFLKSKGGYISRNFFKNSDGELKSAAQIIYEAAHNYDCEGVVLSDKPTRAEREQKCKYSPINPKLLLVLLQKEQSLIEEVSPSQKALDWATGYGVCDDCSMSDPNIQRWKGFGKQVNSASLQFADYLNNPHHYGYKAGTTYTISNTGRSPSIVSIQNHATAALYNYTPHVYWGNFNFFKLWNRYFTKTYTNNTLVQAKGETGVWLIKNGVRRPFLTRGALTSRFDINKIVQINKSDLEAYPIGDPIKFAQYSVVRSPRGTVYLLVDDKRRGFTSGEALRKIGFNPEEIIDASWDDINAYEEGTPITATTTYATGALLQDKSTGGIYYVFEGTKAPLWDRVLLETKFKRKSVFPVESEKLASYKTVQPAIFSDGEILKGPHSPAVYIVDDGKKRPVVSGEAFEELGYKWENVISVPSKILDLYPNGEPLGEKFQELELDLLDPYASSTEESFNIITTTDSSNEAVSLDDNELLEEIEDVLNPLN